MFKKIIYTLLSFITIVSVVKSFRKCQTKYGKILEKYRQSYFKLSDWLCLKQNHNNISDYLKDKNLNRVAIYGYGQIGKVLHNELLESGIEVLYAIDENADCIYWDKINIFFPYEKLPEADIIIISVFEFHNEIKNNLKKFTDNKIVYLSDIIEHLKND